MKYLVMAIFLLLSCKADVEECRSPVTESFGRVKFIYQDTKDSYFNIIWYSIKEDTLILTEHNNSGWEISGSKYLDDNEFTKLCNKNIAIIKKYHNAKKENKKEKTSKSQEVKTLVKDTIKVPKNDEPWGEW